MTCKDVMTANPKCCVRDDTISRAAQIMRDEDVGPVPVVSDYTSRKVIGIVTDRDVAVKIVAAGRDPQSVRVGDVMSTDLITCRVDDDYAAALECMATHQVRRVPVVNDDGSLAGIISQADIARRSSEQEVGEVVEEISEPAGLGHRLGSLRLGYSGSSYQESGVANSLLMGAACLTVGAGVMFLLDPARGRSRRTRLRDKAARYYSDSAWYAGKVQRDVRNRATGLVATAKAKLRREDEVSDQQLEARVRSALGRVTSHPHAIRVHAQNGYVTLEGNILADETNNVLSSVRTLPGVLEVENWLQVHHEAENIPDLQGGTSRGSQRWDFMQSNWSPTSRLLASAIGGGLVLYGLRARGPVAKTVAAAGAGLLTRGISNKEVSSWPDATGAGRVLGY
jgi:CBS domain-containing protein